MAPVVEVSDAGHCRSLLLELNEQRLRGQFCDVTIIAEDTKFQAHKNVLAASSPFFKRALLGHETVTPNPNPAQVLELPGVQAGVFSDVLNFIYNSRLAVASPSAARELGAVGRRLGISCLQSLDGATGGATARDMNGSWKPPAATTEGPVDLTRQPAAEPPAASPASSSSSSSCGLCGRGGGFVAAKGQPRGNRRGLACRHCGKSFVHVKRLQTHEVLCHQEHETPTDAANTVTTTTATTTALKAGKKALLSRHRALEVGMEQEEVTPPAPAVVTVTSTPSQAVAASSSGPVNYVCGVCQRSYVTLSSLKRHANVHSWRRKYPCRYCDKVFALAEYRTKHEVWHTGERRYQCIFCWDTFVTYYNLKTHQKTLHGINPALTASEKTPNGGYKPKLNALKLYRLLPMRAPKRPYKTYSQPLADTGDNEEVGGSSSRPPAGMMSQQQQPEAPSVIAFGRPAPSVIVHSATAAASVIAFNGRPGDVAAAVPVVPAVPAVPAAVPAVPMKKQVLRDYIEAQQRAAGEAPGGDSGAAPSTQPTAGGDGTSSTSGGTSSGGGGRTMTYVAKPAYVGAGGESRAAPLCQITVRIGDEAIVKRRISETDLRLQATTGATSGATRRGGGSSGGSAAYSRRSGDDGSDGDDRLWRPYYNYKPKRKAATGGSGTSGAGTGGGGKAKKSRWCRKLRSLRWAPGEGDGVTAATPTGTAQQSSDKRQRRRHPCRVCGKSFAALRKLRKHQRGHEAGDTGTELGATGGASGVTQARVGRRPSLRFACSRCAKVCKTAAALSRHSKRHRAASPTSPVPPAPPASPLPSGVTCSRTAAPVKEEAVDDDEGVMGSVGVLPLPGDAAATAAVGVTLPPPPTGGPSVGETGVGSGRGGAEVGGYPVQDQPLALLRRGKAAGGGDPENGAGGGGVGGTGGGNGGGGRGGTPPHQAPPPPPPTAFPPLSYGPRLVAAYPYPFPLPLALVLPEGDGFLGGGGVPPALPLPPPSGPPSFSFPGGGERPRKAGGGGN